MIPVFKPLIGDAEKQAAIAALDLGWLGMGSYVQEFEQALESFLEVGDSRHVLALSTGHAALHLGLMLAGVGPGDEVITPSFNSVSDFQAIIACGADPVFCDIDPVTLCLDLNSAARVVSSRTIEWAMNCLGLNHPAVRVLAHNARAVAFYRRIGFAGSRRAALYRVTSDDGSRLTEESTGEAATAMLIHMTLDRT